MNPNLRVGHGFDVHAFCEGDAIRLGGVDIPPKMEGKNLTMVITPTKKTQEKNNQGGNENAENQNENK